MWQRYPLGVGCVRGFSFSCAGFDGARTTGVRRRLLWTSAKVTGPSAPPRKAQNVDNVDCRTSGRLDGGENCPSGHRNATAAAARLQYGCWGTPALLRKFSGAACARLLSRLHGFKSSIGFKLQSNARHLPFGVKAAVLSLAAQAMHLAPRPSPGQVWHE